MNLNEIHSANKVFGGLVDNLHGGFGLVDNLYMTYEGNMLTSVRDVASRLPYAGATDFDGMPGKNPLTYNASGSLVSDAGRGIARIDYDRLNNPVRIQFTNGSVTRYVYSTTGEKLRVIHQTAVPNITVPIPPRRQPHAEERARRQAPVRGGLLPGSGIFRKLQPGRLLLLLLRPRPPRQHKPLQKRIKNSVPAIYNL